MQRLILTSLLLILVAGCNLINPPEELPAYVTVNPPRLVVDSTNGDTIDFGVSDIWIYKSGILQGAFQPPVTIPYNDNSATDFFLEGGVKESGASSFRIPYPFWKQVHFNVNQSVGDTFSIDPVIEYYGPDVISSSLNEGFEGLTTSFIWTGLSNPADTTTLGRTSTTYRFGSKGGEASFDANNTILDVRSSLFPYIPTNVDIWAEVTYKSEIPFTVGLFFQAPSPNISPVTTVVPKGEWNTIYVHLVQGIREIRAAAGDQFLDFGLWIYADGEGETGKVHLDNIRVVYFNP